MVRFGIVGTNWITERLLNAAQHVGGFELSAVYSRTEEKAKSFAEKYKVETTYTDLEEMAKSDKFDAVYIASPNSLHAEQAIIFLEHGKHVLCEKPLASNEREVDAMFAAAKANDVVLMEAMKSTLMPGFSRIQQHLHKIGKVRRYFASFSKYSSRYDAYKEGTVLNAFNPQFSNGALMDLGVYCLYPLVVLFGKPKEVKATSLMLDSGVDGEGSFICRYDDMDGVIMYSKISTSYLPAEIEGEEGSILIEKISEPSDISIKYKDGTTEVISEEAEWPSMAYEVKEFIRLIEMGATESELNSYHHSKMTANILDTVRSQVGLMYPADR